MPTWDPGSPLRSWLRKSPRPSRVRVHTADGEERIIELPADTRSRWKIVEESVIACGAERVECLDEKGAVIRAQRLELDDDTGSPADTYEKQRKSDERMMSRTRLEMAQFAEAYGTQLNRAFDRGAAAANTGQENLVGLVEVLTTHLSLAITNLHNVSVNLANMVTEGGEGEGADTNSKLLAQVVGAAAMRAVGGAGAEHPNGKGKKT
jgi:hypothetical protein